MALNRRQTLAGLAGIVAASSLPLGVAARGYSQISAKEARRLSEEAWVFGLPIVYIERQWLRSSNVSRPNGLQAPVNQFAHFRDFPNWDNQTAVTMNVDTLYSLASIDLRTEPIVLSIPEMGTRYWIMQLTDAWNNVPAAPGSRTVGGKGGNFAIIGPGWNGTLPQGLTDLRMPTSMLLLTGRTFVANQSDLPAVHALQDQYKLVPLSFWRHTYTPPDNVALEKSVDIRQTVQEKILSMPPETFFNNLNRLLVDNPPDPTDLKTMKRLARLGIQAGKQFDFHAFSHDAKQEIHYGMRDGQREMQSAEGSKPLNTWRFSLDSGRFGKRYAYRANRTFYNVSSNLAEDAIYPTTTVDTNNHPLDASQRYVLHFRKDELPPVYAFWSLTMYDSSGYLTQNPINRYALGDRSGMAYNQDGSLTIYIQRRTPGPTKEANWLPTPKEGGMMLMMRLYEPGKAALDGIWKPPAIQRVEYS